MNKLLILSALFSCHLINAFAQSSNTGFLGKKTYFSFALSYNKPWISNTFNVENYSRTATLQYYRDGMQKVEGNRLEQSKERHNAGYNLGLTRILNNKFSISVEMRNQFTRSLLPDELINFSSNYYQDKYNDPNDPYNQYFYGNPIYAAPYLESRIVSYGLYLDWSSENGSQPLGLTTSMGLSLVQGQVRTQNNSFILFKGTESYSDTNGNTLYTETLKQEMIENVNDFVTVVQRINTSFKLSYKVAISRWMLLDLRGRLTLPLYTLSETSNDGALKTMRGMTFTGVNRDAKLILTEVEAGFVIPF